MCLGHSRVKARSREWGTVVVGASKPQGCCLANVPLQARPPALRAPPLAPASAVGAPCCACACVASCHSVTPSSRGGRSALHSEASGEHVGGEALESSWLRSVWGETSPGEGEGEAEGEGKGDVHSERG